MGFFGRRKKATIVDLLLVLIGLGVVYFLGQAVYHYTNLSEEQADTVKSILKTIEVALIIVAILAFVIMIYSLIRRNLEDRRIKDKERIEAEQRTHIRNRTISITPGLYNIGKEIPEGKYSVMADNCMITVFNKPNTLQSTQAEPEPFTFFCTKDTPIYNISLKIGQTIGFGSNALLEPVFNPNPEKIDFDI